MKQRLLIILLSLYSTVFLILQGCVSQEPKATDIPGSKTALPPAPKTILAPQPTIDLLPGYTPGPTLPPSAEEQMAKILLSRECKLPCYLNITPGKTSFLEAAAIMKDLGAHENGEFNEKYGYDLDLGDTLITPIPPNRYALVWNRVSITKTNNLVQVVHVEILAEKRKEALELYREYWSRYSTSGIFFELGKPDKIYIHTDFDKIDNSELIIAYESLGVLVRFRGSRQENNLCPIDENQDVYVTMDLFDPASGFTIVDFNSHLNDPPYWPQVNDVLGINVEEFYERVLADPSVCFEPRVSDP